LDFCFYSIKNYIWLRLFRSPICCIILKINLLVFFVGFSVSLLAQAPEPEILVIRINGQKRAFIPKIPLRLKAQEDDLVLQFRPQPNVTFHYFLENSDKSWGVSPYPIVRYTNIAGGNYTLKIRTTQHQKFSSTLSIPLIVEDFLSEEWWFLPSVIFYSLLLLGAGIYFFLLYNFREKLKVETIRQKIASDLHDEVGATLSSISIATRVVQKKLGSNTNGLSPILEQIKTDSEDTIQTIRDTVWAINPANDSVE
jgi:Histidine kinase